MRVRERQAAVQAYRGQITSPGRPSVAWRGDRVRFWTAIASPVILDGTRVGVAIGASTTFSSWKRILDLRKVREERLEPKQLQVYVGIGFLLLLLTPLLYMDIGAQLRLPYRKLIGLLHLRWFTRRAATSLTLSNSNLYHGREGSFC